MAGCKKADRNRKSVQNTVYKNGNKKEVNKRRKMAKDEKRQAKKLNREFLGKITPRGTARKIARKGGVKHGKKADSQYFTKQIAKAFSGL